MKYDEWMECTDTYRMIKYALDRKCAGIRMIAVENSKLLVDFMTDSTMLACIQTGEDYYMGRCNEVQRIKAIGDLTDTLLDCILPSNPDWFSRANPQMFAAYYAARLAVCSDTALHHMPLMKIWYNATFINLDILPIIIRSIVDKRYIV